MAAGRFRSPKTGAEEIALLSETVIKYKMGSERFYYLAEHENEQKKSTVGNSWRERT